MLQTQKYTKINIIQKTTENTFIFLGDLKLNQGKKLENELMQTTCYGIGNTYSKIIQNLGGIGKNNTISLLPKNKHTYLQKIMENLIIGWRLRQQDISNLKYQIKIGTYRGLRLQQGLPSHGQRTSTNGGSARRRINK